MTLLNKVCHAVGKTSRQCQCVFMAEGVHSGCSPGLFAHVPSLQRRNSFRRPTSRAASLSFPCLPAQTRFHRQQVFQPYLLLHLPFNQCRNPAHGSWLPYHIPPLPCTSTHASALVTPGLSNLVMPLNPALAFCILSTECKTSSCLGAWPWLVTIYWVTGQ